jgi:uncharacterized protein YlxP (DUF503 family)
LFTGSLVVDVLLGDVHSLKEKRAVVRPVLAELRRRFAVSAAEVGAAELHRRASIGVAVVAGEAGHVAEVLDGCERLVAGRPELVLLSARRQLTSDGDWETPSPEPRSAHA